MTTQRKLVQFIDGLQNSLVLNGSNSNNIELVWQRVSGVPAESMWVVETVPSGKGVRCQNYRYPMVYLENIGQAVRAISTTNYPVPLPISFSKSDAQSNPYRFSSADGRTLSVRGDMERRAFDINTIANQNFNVSKKHFSESVSGWSIFGIVLIILAIIGVIVGVVFLYKRGEMGLGSQPSQSIESVIEQPVTVANEQSTINSVVFDVFAS